MTGLDITKIDFRWSLPGPWQAHQVVPDDELEDGEWQKPEPAPPSAPTVGDVYEAAPAPRMVKTPPRGEGLYFIRVPGNPIRVVDVYRKGTTWVASWSDIPEFEVVNSGYEFSDRPIREPV